MAAEFLQYDNPEKNGWRDLTAGDRIVTGVTGETCLTQLVDNTALEALIGIACSAGGITTPNEWLRVYDIDGDFVPTEVVYGVETATGNVDLTVTAYAVPAGSCGGGGVVADACLAGNAICSTSFEQADTADPIIDIAALAGCTAVDGDTQDLVVEVAATEDCNGAGTCLNFFPGGNSFGQTAPVYIAADACNLFDAIDLALLDPTFDDNNILIDVCGNAGAVPAMGALGALLTILALGAGSGYAIRRRTA